MAAAGKRLPLRSKRFDAVISALVLEHVENLEYFFREARRVARPGAALYVSAMHPAMLLRGSQAGFKDEAGRRIRPRGFPYDTADFVNAALRAGLKLDGLEELCGDAELARRFPRAVQFRGWPMILVLRLRRPG
jgi:malonyl-CoA O-methyltransferase